MIDDIFHVSVCINTREREATFGLYYIQLTEVDSFAFSVLALAQGWVENLNVLLRAVLSEECEFQGVKVRQVHSDAGDVLDPPTIRTGSTGTGTIVGTVTGASMIANLPTIINLTQAIHGPKGNGRIFLPGMSEAQVNGNVIQPTFLAGALNDFTEALGWQASARIQASGDAGTFGLGVISAKVAYAPIKSWIDGGMIGPKPGRDYAGAFSPCTGVSVAPIIGRQKRRATKAFGARTLAGA